MRRKCGYMGEVIWLENALFEIDRISKYPNIGSKIYKDKNGATMLFENIYHPNDILLNRICKRLLELLNIKDVNCEKVYHMGCTMEIFILLQVKHALGMT